MSRTNIADGMSELFEHGWVDFFEKHRDPRVRDWLFLDSLVPLLVLLGLYLIFCLRFGEKLMANRAAFEIKNCLLVYNLVNVVFNSYLFMESWQFGVFSRHSFSCEPIDYSNTPIAIREARFGHLYFLTKIADLLDTVFFIVRKKDKQVTGLHIYHHSTMPLVAWMSVNFVGGGHYAFGVTINTFVHVVMYSYYFLAAVVPSKYLWWKKYITTLQLIQFVMLIIHEGQVLINGCDIPKSIAVVHLVQGFIFFYMFSKFYARSYSSNSKKKM